MYISNITPFIERTCFILIYILITLSYSPLLDTMMSFRSCRMFQNDYIVRAGPHAQNTNTFRIDAKKDARADSLQRHGFIYIVYHMFDFSRMRARTWVPCLKVGPHITRAYSRQSKCEKMCTYPCLFGYIE